MSGHRSRRGGPRLLIALLAGLALQVGFLQITESRAAGTGDPAYVGMSLKEALLELRSRGLKIVFTTQVVRPGMQVAAEPVSSDPRQVLDELLEPHGLMVREGPRDTLVVIRRPPGASPPGASIGGVVRSRPDSDPVAGAVIRVVESGLQATSSRDGTFLIPEHDAGSFTLIARRAGFTVERVGGVAVRAGQRTEIAILLHPAPVYEETLVVTPSRVSLLREKPGTSLGLSREEILALPHLGDDFFRTVSLLPGVAANDVSARFHVRGGRRDETQILLDGQELYEAYHLKDFDSALSFISASTLRSADLSTGGFSAEFGDRMAGVLDMTTVHPSGRPHGRLGMSVLNLQAGGAGGFRDDRGSWLVEARRGTVDLVEKLIGSEHPLYADAYAKMAYQLDDRNSLRFNFLYSNDELHVKETIDEESKQTDNAYHSAYFWLTHRMVLGNQLTLETAVSRSKLDEDRFGEELEEDVQFKVHDKRETEVLGLSQGWSFQATGRHFLKWGFELRAFDTRYDYDRSDHFDTPLALIRHDHDDEPTVFNRRFREKHNSLYVADRMHLVEPLTLELGLRFDGNSLTDENHLTPRFNLAWSLNEASVLRLAWGRFNQSQRPYELQVEDGDTFFYPTERSEHRVLGFERIFARDSKHGGLVMRAEVYQRRVRNPRPRYENLYEAINTFPEIEPDRVHIAPEQSTARGVELYLQGRVGPRLGWWANYAYASTEDRISGRYLPRKYDQTHTLNLDLDYRVGRHWHLNLAWRYHTGWPTTPLSLREEVDSGGETVFRPVLGPLYSVRLPVYHRLDLRASRKFRAGRGTLVFFIDVQNAYNRKNLAGFDIQIEEEDGTIDILEEYWAGILPSAGVTYEF